jgi:hypothetical protein
VQGRLQHRFQRATAGHKAHRAPCFSRCTKRVRHERVAQQRMFGYGERNGAFRRVQQRCNGLLWVGGARFERDTCQLQQARAWVIRLAYKHTLGAAQGLQCLFA